jgi:hypothetical protein
MKQLSISQAGFGHLCVPAVTTTYETVLVHRSVDQCTRMLASVKLKKMSVPMVSKHIALVL